MPEDEISVKGHKFRNCFCSFFSIFLDSLKIIFLQNPKLFIKIYTFTTLPLSLLLTSFSVSSTPRFLKSHINRLQWLYHAVPIWVEAANIRDESRADFRKLLWVRFFYGVPILAFSLIALVTLVVSAYLSCSNSKKKLNFREATTALKLRWAPPVLTCMVNFIVWVGWSHLDPFFNRIALNYLPYFTAVQVVVEVYMMTVLSLALVVSVVEGRVGFDAVWVGFDEREEGLWVGFVGLDTVGFGFDWERDDCGNGWWRFRRLHVDGRDEGWMYDWSGGFIRVVYLVE